MDLADDIHAKARGEYRGQTLRLGHPESSSEMSHAFYEASVYFGDMRMNEAKQHFAQISSNYNNSLKFLKENNGGYLPHSSYHKEYLRQVIRSLLGMVMT